MANLIWDGDIEDDLDTVDELSDGEQLSAKPTDTDSRTESSVDTIADVEAESTDETENTDDTTDKDDKLERINELADGKDSDDCEHTWSDVSQEEMERVVSGKVIDTQQIYWCSRCQTILDTLDE